MLKRQDHEWQRLIASTGQPNFLDKQNMIKYIAKEQDRDIERRNKYITTKCDFLGDCADGKHVAGASSSMNY